MTDIHIPQREATTTDILKRIDRKFYVQNRILEEILESLREMTVILDSVIQERAYYDD